MSTRPGSTLLAILAAAASALVFCGVTEGYWKEGESPLPKFPDGEVGKVYLGAAERIGAGFTTSCSTMKPAPPIARTSTSALSVLGIFQCVLLTGTVFSGVSGIALSSADGTTGLSSSQSIGISFLASTDRTSVSGSNV